MFTVWALLYILNIRDNKCRRDHSMYMISLLIVMVDFIFVDAARKKGGSE